MQELSSGDQGRVGIQVETTSFAVAPGNSVTIPVVLSNHGLEADVLSLAVDGIPGSWAYASSPSTLLNPGQARQVSLTIQPPHSLQASAGQHPFRIQVTSQLAPGQAFEVACSLTIGAFAEFSSELRPQRVEDGEPARVTVENQGNIPQAFTLTWQSPDSGLVFEPAPTQELHVAPGELAMAEFRTRLRHRPFFGGEFVLPFTTRVQPADGQPHNLSGEVVGRALIPGWLLAVLLVLAVAIACLSVLSVGLMLWGGGAPEGVPAEPPAVQPTDEAAQPAPTEPPLEQPTAEPPPEQPTEPPPEQPTEPPPEQPTEEAAERPTREQPEQPTGEPGQPEEPGQACPPIALGLILVPALVLFKKRGL